MFLIRSIELVEFYFMAMDAGIYHDALRWNFEMKEMRGLCPRE